MLKQEVVNVHAPTAYIINTLYFLLYHAQYDLFILARSALSHPLLHFDTQISCSSERARQASLLIIITRYTHAQMPCAEAWSFVASCYFCESIIGSHHS